MKERKKEKNETNESRIYENIQEKNRRRINVTHRYLLMIF